MTDFYVFISAIMLSAWMDKCSIVVPSRCVFLSTLFCVLRWTRQLHKHVYVMIVSILNNYNHTHTHNNANVNASGKSDRILHCWIDEDRFTRLFHLINMSPFIRTLNRNHKNITRWKYFIKNPMNSWRTDGRIIATGTHSK